MQRKLLSGASILIVATAAGCLLTASQPRKKAASTGVSMPRGMSDIVTVSGLIRPTLYPDSAACYKKNSGCDFTFLSGRRFEVSSFYNQNQDAIMTKDESGQTQFLPYDFKEVWVPSDSGQTEPPNERQGSLLLFGQYDFTGELPNSLVVVSARDDKQAGFTRCGANIYTLNGNTWSLTGVLNTSDVIGVCEINFKVNKVTIPRHLRGFYHQLTFQNNRFEDTSDF